MMATAARSRLPAMPAADRHLGSLPLRVRRSLIAQRTGETAYDALRRALSSESSGP